MRNSKFNKLYNLIMEEMQNNKLQIQNVNNEMLSSDNSLNNTDTYYIYVKMVEPDDPSVGYRFDGFLSVTDEYVDEYGDFNENQEYIEDQYNYYTDDNSVDSQENIIKFSSIQLANKFAYNFLAYNYYGEKNMPRVSSKRPLTFIDTDCNCSAYADDEDSFDNQPFIVCVTKGKNIPQF